MSEATLRTAGARPVVRLERHLSRPVSEVWQAVTDPAELRSWFPTRMEMGEWAVGAEITHHFDGHDIAPLPGRVLAWDPPHRVSFTWAEDIITFELAPTDDGGTVFVLSEELSPAAAARNAAGWDSCLDRLEFGADKGEWQLRFDRYAAEFTPALGPQEGPPAGYRAPPE